MDITRGKNGWLYLESFESIKDKLTGKISMSLEEINTHKINYKLKKKECEAIGAKYIVFVCPDKHVVYPENLPEDVFINKSRYINEFIDVTQGLVVYPLDDIVREKGEHLLYMTGDSHWNNFGATIAFNCCARQMGLSTQIHIDETTFHIKKNKGDLCVNEYSSFDNIIENIRYRPTAREFWVDGLAGYCSVSVYENSDKTLPTALCFGDSFVKMNAPLFASLFSRLVFVYSFNKFWELSYFNEKFDFVISQCVEHSLPMFVKSKAQESLVRTLENRILNNAYSSKMLDDFKEVLDEDGCIYHKNDKQKIANAIKLYRRNLTQDHVINSVELAGELQKLEVFSNISNNKHVGAIVVNCNPFTRGHRFLIEHASKCVDVLFVFVLQEDRSYFPFLERFLLTMKGTKDLRNVIPIPSGKFIISTSTFKDYFGKDNFQDVVIDASTDLDIFSDFIAPRLGITVRFVGNEPFCKITNQYNDQMMKLLPPKGIDVVKIDRFEIDSLAVSASRVRLLHSDHNYEQLSKIVPETTYSYLRRYGELSKGMNYDDFVLKKDDNIFIFIIKLFSFLVDQKRQSDAFEVLQYSKKICWDVYAKFSLAKVFFEYKFFSEAEALYLEIFHELSDSRHEAAYNFHISYSLLLRAQGRIGEAIHEAMHALRYDPENPNANYHLANLYKDSNNYGKAESCYRKAIEINPDIVDFHTGYGKLLEDVGRPQDAIVEMMEVLRLSPDKGAINHCLAKLNRQAGNFGLAEHYYQMALKENPDIVNLYIGYSQLLGDMNRDQDAIEQAVKALLLDPYNPNLVFYMSELYNKIYEFGLSERYYLRAIEMKPDAANFRAGYSQFLNNLGRTSEAIEQALEMYLIDQANPNVCHYVANLYKKIGNFDLAGQWYVKAISLGPEVVNYYIGYSKLLCRIGNISRAIEFASQALQLDPANTEIVTYLDKLREQSHGNV